MEKKQNIMRKIRIEKIILSIGGTGEYLDKGEKLLKLLTGRKPKKTRSKKRIPGFGIRPGLEVGVLVTIRKNKRELLKKMLSTIDNKLKKSQISTDNFSFGIKEYIEIPGMEYNREIGIMGLDVTIVFKRAGKRIKIKKEKRGKLPKKQHISKEEIIKFMEENFNTQFI